MAVDSELMQRKKIPWRTLLPGFGSRHPRQELGAEGAQSQGTPCGLNG
jgi:hypothetical protein